MRPIGDETRRIDGALVVVQDQNAERKAARTRQALMTMASQEIRTPLATTRGTAE
ncbi:MAG: hypothetical protein U0556_15815 [Dehalococcoidia bacterium]